MKSELVFGVAALACVGVLSSSAVRAEECRCPGKELVQHRGGNEKVGWQSLVSLVREGNSNSPSLICYKRSVINKNKPQADSALFNIKWDVASFRRRVIPAGYTNDSCATLPGTLSNAPVNGPLYYGVSSDSIDTTVQTPQQGWQQQEAQGAPQQNEYPPIRSVFEVGLDESGAEATIVIYSYVSMLAGQTKVELTYEIENRGPQEVSFILNLPVLGGMERLEFLKGTILKPNSRTFFDSYVESRVTAQTVAVRVADAKATKVTFATETVGVYAPVDGKRIQPDKALLESIP